MKRFISGFLLGALIFAVPAIANNAKTIEAFYNNIKLSVYGQIVDTEGNEPFIVGGRTYVPARYVAEAMGGVVKWNETENTVEVTRQTPETTATPKPTKLTSDGLEAVYFSGNNETPGGYYVKASAIRNKYNFFALNHGSDSTALVWNEKLSAKTEIINTLPINGVLYLPENDYETVVLPLLTRNVQGN